MRVHQTLGPGFLESVYHKSLAHELSKAGLKVECHRAVQVIYNGVVVGDFIADMLVADRVLVENKAVQSLVQAHEAQLVNYLATTGIEIGLLLNFWHRVSSLNASIARIVQKAKQISTLCEVIFQPCKSCKSC